MKIAAGFLKTVTKNRWVFLFALLYAVVVYLMTPYYMPLFDSATYADIASNLAAGRGFLLVDSPTGDVPLLPTVLAGLMLLLGEGWMSAYLAMASFLMVISLFYLVEELRKGSGLISVLILSTLALPVFLSLQVLTDVLFLAFVNTGMILLLRCRKTASWENTLLLSVIVSGSYLLRPTGLFFIGFALLVCLWYLVKKRIPLSKFVTMIIIAVFAVGAWEVATGKIAATQGSIGEKSKTASLSFSLADAYNGDISFGGDVPIQLGNIVRLNILLLIFVMPAMLLVFIWEMWRLLKEDKKSFEAWFLILWLAAFLLPHLTAIPSLVARYLMPILPVFIVLFADSIRRNWRKKTLMVVLLITIHLGTAWLACQWYYPRTGHLTTKVFMEAGEWIDSLPADAAFMVSGIGRPEFHYYSGRLPEKEGTADFVIKSNMVKVDDITTEGLTLCKRFGDEFYWLEVWGQSC